MTERTHIFITRWRFCAAALSITSILSFGVPAAGQYSGTGATATYAPGQSSVGSGLTGSVPSGPATNEVLHLTLRDAIDRAPKYNLGSIESGENTHIARGQRFIALSQLLPQLQSERRQVFLVRLPAHWHQV